MPIKAKLFFKLEKPTNKTSLYPERIHALFFSLLPFSISSKLHSEYKLKPFTLSFQKYFTGKEEEISHFILDITLLEDSLFPYFSEGMIVKKEHLSIASIPIIKKKILSIEHKSYKELLENKGDNKDFLFYFETPTSFRKGKFDYPLPEPTLIFKSLIRKWNFFSPQKINISAKELSSALRLGGAWIKTKKVSLSEKNKLLGFYGRVFIDAPTDKPSLLKLLNALYLFSPFSGVGRKTTMGAGKVSIL